MGRQPLEHHHRRNQPCTYQTHCQRQEQQRPRQPSQDLCYLRYPNNEYGSWELVQELLKHHFQTLAHVMLRCVRPEVSFPVCNYLLPFFTTCPLIHLILINILRYSEHFCFLLSLKELPQKHMGLVTNIVAWNIRPRNYLQEEVIKRAKVKLFTSCSVKVTFKVIYPYRLLLKETCD